jgi:CheY-like chemotaxis protein
MPQLASLDALVVDDHEPTRAILERMLHAAGVARVRSAANGAQALEMLEQRAADLVITDHAMPEMDGPALIARIRADAKLNHARTVLISGYAGGEASGAHATLTKPIEAPALLRAIEKALA